MSDAVIRLKIWGRAGELTATTHFPKGGRISHVVGKTVKEVMERVAEQVELEWKKQELSWKREEVREDEPDEVA